MLARRMLAVALATMLGGSLCPSAFAQKGMGDAIGLARQRATPELITVTGKLTAIETKPCEKTTGKAVLGTHMMLKTAAGEELNVHLGWSEAVAPMIERLDIGDRLRVVAFHTEKMPENHLVAKSLRIGDRTIELRDDALRPVWAGPAGKAAASRGEQRRYRGGR